MLVVLLLVVLCGWFVWFVIDFDCLLVLGLWWFGWLAQCFLCVNYYNARRRYFSVFGVFC